jgi:hypothetical protein
MFSFLKVTVQQILMSAGFLLFLEELQVEGELADFNGLSVDVHAIDIV